MMTSDDALISSEYLKEQCLLHAHPRGYGAKGGKWARTVVAIAHEYGCQSVLDYGCGQGSLGVMLRAAPVGLDVREYDPAIKGKNGLPKAADLVVCTDVLEHIEPVRLDAVLRHLYSVTVKAAFLVIALDPANKVLSDGRNAHLILESRDWWRQCVSDVGFQIQPWCEEWPLPEKMTAHPEKQRKRWIVVATPC